MQTKNQRYTMQLQNNEILFCLDETIIFSVNCNEIAGFSNSFPWELAYLTDVKVTQQEQVITLTGRSQCGSIVGEFVFIAQAEEIAIQANWRNSSSENLSHGVFQFGFPVGDVTTENITLPHVLYNDNPSADPSRIVAHMGDKAGDGVIVEEHRLPIPAVNIEWHTSETYGVSFFSLPAVADGRDEHYWSLGAIKTSDKTRLQSLSGQTLFNGIKDMVYAGKNAPLPFERGYKTLLPKEEYTKEYRITMQKAIPKGHGFRDVVKQGYRIFQPSTVPAFSLEETIAMKSNCLDSRYEKKEDVSGYLTFGSANQFGNRSGRPDYYLYGWTGQAIQLAWCDYTLGERNNDRARQEKALETVDFFAKGAQHPKVPGLLNGYYMVKEKEWRGASWNQPDEYSSRIQGEAAYGLLDVMLLLRQKGENPPAVWEETTRNALAFLMDETHQTSFGLYPLLWDEKGIPMEPEINSSGISCVVALAKGYRYFQEERYLDYAKDMLHRYYKHQMADFSLPFCRATMDARCEDKEAGMYFFLAADELFQITQDNLYKEWAEIAGDWILTFVYHWETQFLPESEMTTKGFRTTGWSGVSVQNHHLDVFFPCYEMYRFGKTTGNQRFEHMGRTVAQAFTHGICSYPGEWGFDVVGEQSEQFYQTNFFMGNYPDILPSVAEWRKGLRWWNPSWIIEQVLKSSLCFELDETYKK